ncbi:Reverse transcriptase domain [Cinara cedri]|uniref:Reverse transcriptase domain n=1 Tax=Cinara cedri TaxID=506608 RepID=A0A5E4NAT2_9HEMI|nr:Reverse transcriptase domain [Cinara cedri]
MAVTTHIENGYDRNVKTAVAFIDLSSAYDTVWRKGLLLKFLDVIPCKTVLKLINKMLCNRCFTVYIGEEKRKIKMLNNGLSQDSVLAPLLFNLYIRDLPATTARKFIYTDDLVLACQSKNFDDLENILSEDLDILHKFFNQRRLKPNPSKTEVTFFHLNNRRANQEIWVQFGEQLVKNNPYPKYLGVVLDRTLTFKNHLAKLSAKIKTRHSIILKLSGTSWEDNANTLRITMLSLVYSAAEYCAPVWINSTHTNKLDTQLNSVMRIIGGTLKTTPLKWLPVLSNIAPPRIRRE